MSNADETRNRILETAWQLARERGLAAVTVADIAAAAGVSRQLVYVHFSNRAGLLVAMARHQDSRSGFRGARWRPASSSPCRRLEELLRAWLAYVPEILPVVNELEAAVITGGEAADAWRDRMGELHEAFRLAIERIAGAGALADGWSRRRRGRLGVGALPAVEPRHLVVERGWDAAEYAEPDHRLGPAREWSHPGHRMFSSY